MSGQRCALPQEPMVAVMAGCRCGAGLGMVAWTVLLWLLAPSAAAWPCSAGPHCLHMHALYTYPLSAGTDGLHLLGTAPAAGLPACCWAESRTKVGVLAKLG